MASTTAIGLTRTPQARPMQEPDLLCQGDVRLLRLRLKANVTDLEVYLVCACTRLENTRKMA